MINVGGVEVDVVPSGAQWTRGVAKIVSATPTQKIMIDADLSRARTSLRQFLATQANLKVIADVEYRGNAADAIKTVNENVLAAQASIIPIKISFIVGGEATANVVGAVLAAQALVPDIDLDINVNRKQLKAADDAIENLDSVVPVNLNVETRSLHDLKRTLDTSDFSIPVNLAIASETKVLTELRAAWSKVTKGVTVPLNPEVNGEAVIDARMDMLRFAESLGREIVNVDLSVHVEENGLDANLRAPLDALQDEWGHSLHVHTVADGIDNIRRELIELQRNQIMKLRVDLDTTKARAEQDRLNGDTVSMNAELSNALVIEKQIDRLTRDRNINIDIDKNSSGALGALGSTLGAVGEGMSSLASLSGALGPALQTVTKGLNGVASLGSGAATALGGTAASAGETLATLGPVGIVIALVAAGAVVLTAGVTAAGGAFVAFTTAALAASAVATLMATGVAVLAGAIASLPVVLGAATGGIAVLVLALKPIIETFQAFMAVEDQQAGSATKNAKANTSASNAIAAATRGVENAKRSELKAHQAVSDAIEQETKRQRDLRQSIIDGKLAAEDAALSITAAKERYAEVQADPSSSLNDIRQAELAVREAENNAKKTGTNNKDLAADLAESVRKGIEGSDLVTDARERERSATEAVTAAQEALVAANTNLANTTAGASTQLDKYNSLLGDLTPAGQALVEVLKTLFAKDGIFDNVGSIMQTAVLPGITAVVEAFGALFGSLDKKGNFQAGPLLDPLKQVGDAIGEVAFAFSNMLKDPKVIEALQTLLEVGADFIKTFGTALVPVLGTLLTAFGDMAASFDFNPLIDGVVGLVEAITPLFTSLLTDDVLAGISSAMTGFFGILGGVIKLLGPFIARLAEIGGPILEKLQGPLLLVFGALLGMLDQFISSGIMDSFVTLVLEIGAAFAEMVSSGVITDLGKAFMEVVEAIAPMIPLFVEKLVPVLPDLIDAFLQLSLVFIDMLPMFIDLIPPLMTFVGLLVDTLLPILPELIEFMTGFGVTGLAVIGVVLAALTAPLLLFIWLIKGIVAAAEWMWDVLFGHSIFPDIRDGIEDVFDAIEGFWNDTLKPVFVGIINVAKDIWTNIRDAFNNVVTFVGGLGDRIAKAAKGMWDGITSTFKGVLNFLIDAWNALDFGIDITVPDWVPGIGGKGFKVDDIIPDIPRLANGGLVTGPTLAMIGEGGHSELVVPLNRLGNLANILAANQGGSTTHNESKTVNVTQIINNPLPERASTSGPDNMRRAAYALG